MAIQTYKDINPQFISIRPMNLYKQWNLTNLDFTTQPDLWYFISASAARDGYVGDLNTYYADYLASYSGSIPNFPGLNVKYARYHVYETGSITGPNTNVMDNEGYILSYNYQLGNGDRFYPLYQSQSGWINPDGSYERMVHYSLNKLFYAPNATYNYLLNTTASILNTEAIVFEIPQRYIADIIQEGTFTLLDSNDVNNLPYGASGSTDWAFSPYNNTIDSNSLAIEGINLFDDGNGNIYDYNYSSSVQRGNIFYELGLVVITDVAYARYFREYLIISGNIL